jgi:hypothetical protein
METSAYLTEHEWASLAEVGTGFCHAPISLDHTNRLLELKLIYNLLGSCRLTTAGRQMLQSRSSTTTAHSALR